MSTDGRAFPNHELGSETEDFRTTLDGCDIYLTKSDQPCLVVYFDVGVSGWVTMGRFGWSPDYRRNHLPESVIQMTEALWKLHS